jgi:hypothetical protein
MTYAYKLFGGRCTFFALIFTASGIWLAHEGKLTTIFVTLVGAVQTLILAHSAKEDYHERRMVAVNGTEKK